ncbi:hypothetical protein CWI75_00075 [Kineobactrum sediminis]|uniref:Uncharacterized protein n=1 Tax=Kineobactrum sediminis TaxID=1905677 RepID=A0A2N5Y5Y7_9GAMM|nr:hypothetical protein CWI75_00075 [Kineobactrum sediminis]
MRPVNPGGEIACDKNSDGRIFCPLGFLVRGGCGQRRVLCRFDRVCRLCANHESGAAGTARCCCCSAR